MSNDYRVKEHPILKVEEPSVIEFTWQGEKMYAQEGETIVSALFANGVRIFGHHTKDGAPQGIFCANGQCAQCLVIADGLPVKSCMVLVEPGMAVLPVDEKPALPTETTARIHDVPEIATECLVIGGGPAGLSAAIELGKVGVDTLLVDDKHRLGGKLVLQTHRFFGSVSACYAGTRGIDIATILANEVAKYDRVECWTNSTVLAVFSDHKVGILRDGKYMLVKPEVILVAAGAREKSLVFKGNTLPGVYGAGAFQTLVNRDLVRSAERLFIVGGGNVGLIAGYHALQAGIEVVGLVEALPECGGYKVHKDKLARFGVPIYTSHTILSANGADGVESVTIAQIDENFQAIPGTEKSFACDTVLIAVGLDPVDEFYHKARAFGMTVFAAGDAEEIAEASAAMFSGKIKGLEIARALGRDVPEVPPDWIRTSEILKSRPGEVGAEVVPENDAGVFPVLHCSQEIPCNPCAHVCPQGLIRISEDDVRRRPEFVDAGECTGCAQCVAICPGLAITLVDYRASSDMPRVTIPYEFAANSITKGDVVTVLDTAGRVLGNVEVIRARKPRMGEEHGITMNTGTLLVTVAAPREIAKDIAGIRVQEDYVGAPLDSYVQRLTDDVIVCRCERVTVGEIKQHIRNGVRDMNELKALTRAGMGACGGKTCTNLIKRVFREMGVPLAEVTENTARPLFVEVPLGVFAGLEME